ncbi:MAG: carbon monoxide dehydrogenase subunit G [Flavobacteriales bacterium]|jgi:carbon monoxide dehydrogenase subunit G
MTNIESKTVTLNKGAEKVFNYIIDLNHFEFLLPMDKLSNWESNENSCSFKIQGSAHIGLDLFSKTEFNQIVIKSSPKTPFPFTLTISLKEEDGKTVVSQLCEAEINSFLKMMVEKPLKNLFDFIADRLTAVSEEL